MEFGAKYNSWTYSQGRGGKQKVENTTGCLIVEHDPTGKFIVLTSNKISHEARLQLQAIMQEKHIIKTMNKLWKIDPCLRFIEYPTNGIREANRLEKKIRELVSPKYLLLN